MQNEEEWVTGNVRISVAGHPLDISMTVPARPVKPHRMLPVIHQMTNSFVGIGVEAAESEGRQISCKAGCGACCRQPVPIGEIEVYQIKELVASMPEPRRSEIEERFRNAVSHFRNNGWFDRISELALRVAAQNGSASPKELNELVMEYFREGIPCPFLEDESCSIHNDRPVACREYLVTSPAENCTSPTGETIEKVEPPIKVSIAVKKVGSTGRFAGAGIIPLIRALELAESGPERFEEKTGERWMADLFGALAAERPNGPEGSKPVDRAAKPRKPRRKRRR